MRSSTARELAIVRDYDDLHAVLRARADELNVSRLTIDHVAGLQDGYTAKLLAPVPLKRVGAISMGPLLAALGLALVVVEDPEALERVSSRLVPRYSGRGATHMRRSEIEPSASPAADAVAAQSDLDDLEQLAQSLSLRTEPTRHSRKLSLAARRNMFVALNRSHRSLKRRAHGKTRPLKLPEHA